MIVLFCDICSFLWMLEVFLFKDIIVFLIGFLMLMCDILFVCKVMIDKFIGDVIFVFWNVLFDDFW